MNGEFFNQIYIPDSNRDRFWEVFTPFLQKFIQKDSAVLDIGAGYCNFINLLEAKDKSALDIYNISQFANITVKTMKMDCTKLNLRRTYDVVFISNVLEHLPKEEIAPLLKKIRKHCRRIIVLGPNYKHSYKDYFDDPTHLTPMSHITLSRMLIEAGFNITKVYPKIVPFSVQVRPGKPFPYIPKLLMKAYLYSPIKLLAGQMLIVGD